MNKKFKNKRETRRRLLEKEKKKRLEVAEQNNIEKIFKAFLKTEMNDFANHIGIQQSDIERVGKAKFIKALGYLKPEDVGKWRNDKFHLTICPDCKKEFGIFELFSICPECEKKYDMSKLNRAISSAARTGELSVDFYTGFFMYRQMRDFYLKDHNNKELSCIYLLELNTKTGKFDVNIVEDVEVGSIVQFVMSDGTIYKEDNNVYFRITKKTNIDGEFVVEYESEKKYL